MEKKYIEFHISDKKFSVSVEKLKLLPDSRMGRCLKDPNDKTELVFDRPIKLFKAIHSYVQMGKLHMPMDCCPQAFVDEVEFWKMDITCLEPCCANRLAAFLDEKKRLDQFHKELSLTDDKKYTRTMKEKIWNVLENRSNCSAAKVYIMLTSFLVFVSVLSLSISTLPHLKKRLTTLEMKKTFGDTDPDLDDFLKCLYDWEDPWEIWNNLFGKIKTNLKIENFSEEINMTNYEDCTSLSKTDLYKFYKTKIPFKTSRHVAFSVIDHIVLGFFTIDLLLRLATCPKMKMFLTSFLNVLDAFIVVISFVALIVESQRKKLKYEKRMEMCVYVQVFRVLRVLRIAGNIAEVKVFVHCIKTNARDIIVLLFYVLIIVLLSSSLLYFCEDQKNIVSIPEAWWYSIVTMTTVGYGDIVPKSVGGKILGSICALSGVFIFALAIPVFVNSYTTLYRFVHLDRKFFRPPKEHENLVDSAVEMAHINVQVQ